MIAANVNEHRPLTLGARVVLNTGESGVITATRSDKFCHVLLTSGRRRGNRLVVPEWKVTVQ